MRRESRVGVLSGIALGVVIVLLYAPLAQLLVSSINANAVTVRWRGFTTRWYTAAFDNQAVRDAMVRSVRLAVFVALASAVSGTAAAIGLRHTPRLRAVLSALATARIATPELVLAVALGVLIPLVDMELGWRTMWLGHTVLLSAYVVLIVGTSVSGLEPTLEEAAADLGAGPLRVVKNVVLPHVAPAVGAATLLVAAFSFDDVLLSSRLSGPTDATLPMVIFSMATRRTTPEIDAIGALVAIAGFVAFVLTLGVGAALRRRAIAPDASPSK